MFLDAVLDHNNNPIFNDTPAAVKTFLEGKTEEERRNLIVFTGETLGWFTVKEYLER